MACKARRLVLAHKRDRPPRPARAEPPPRKFGARRGATILFILALGGLSNPETARRGNLYGIIGMSIALLAAIAGAVTANHVLPPGSVGASCFLVEDAAA